ncbi:MAG: N-formylglutamate amidohydrolase, partial [Clostridia bacterium]|nr:N-formylglutamate amidohydrolase [Clostridia bacterium]
MFQKVIFHVPHDGTQFPKELMQSVCIAPDRFLAYHKKMRDTAARLFAPPELGEVISFDVSRLLCDVERFTDGTEPMERFGMGFCYERV